MKASDSNAASTVGSRTANAQKDVGLASSSVRPTRRKNRGKLEKKDELTRELVSGSGLSIAIRLPDEGAGSISICSVIGEFY
jgi:hypothetical protein